MAAAIAAAMLLLSYQWEGHDTQPIMSAEPAKQEPKSYFPAPRGPRVTLNVGPFPFEPTTCEAEREEARARLREAASDPGCHADLVASGCPPKVDHPQPYFTREVARGQIERNLERCAPALRRRAVVDCSEFPCVVLVPRDAALDTACLQLEPVAESDEPGGIELEYAAFSETGGAFVDAFYGPLFDQRWKARKHLLARRLQGAPSTPVLEEAPCFEVRAVLERLERDPSCEVVKWERACSPDEDLSIDSALVRRHIEEAHDLVEAFERDCPSFRDRPYALDCSDVPCVLAIAEGPGDPFCGHPMRERPDAQVVIIQDPPQWRCAPTLVVPLWEVADLATSAPELEERYFSRTWLRKSNACQALQAVQDAPE